MQTAAILAVILLGLVAAFQLALAAGAPLGRAAWGGQHEGVLPSRLRLSSAVTGLVVYPLIIAVVLAASSADGGWLGGAAEIVLWVLAAFFTVGAVMNLASRSKLERIWSPVSLAIATCCALLAMQA